MMTDFARRGRYVVYDRVARTSRKNAGLSIISVIPRFIGRSAEERLIRAPRPSNYHLCQHDSIAPFCATLMWDVAVILI